MNSIDKYFAGHFANHPELARELAAQARAEIGDQPTDGHFAYLVCTRLCRENRAPIQPPRLPPSLRKVMHRLIDGKSIADISGEVGMSEDGVEARARRALTLLGV